MIVFAVDPGSSESAIVAFDGRTIHFASVLPNDKLLAMVRASNGALSGKRFVIERIGHYGTGMPAGETIYETVYFSGNLEEAARMVGAKPEYVKRPTVKTHLCGNPRAKDANVRQALVDKYGPEFMKQLKNDDLRSAMAVADWAMGNQPR